MPHIQYPFPFLNQINSNLAFLNNKFLVGMPGCARSPSLNGLDLILRMLVADINIDKQIIASLGVGGLLKDTKLRPFPRNKIK